MKIKMGIVLLTLVFLVACSEKEAIKKHENKEDETNGLLTIEASPAIVTITNIEKSKGHPEDKLEDGKEYTFITVEIASDGTSSVKFSEKEFSLETSNGESVGISYTKFGMGKKLGTGEIHSGKQVGFLAFQLPIDEKNVEFVYEPSFLKGEPIRIKLPE